MNSLPVLPMMPSPQVVFPYQVTALHVSDPRMMALLAEVSATSKRFGVWNLHQSPGEGRLLGTMVTIEKEISLSGGHSFVVVRGEQRLEIDGWLASDDYPRARVQLLPTRDCVVDSRVLDAAENALRAVRNLEIEMDLAPHATGIGALDSDPGVRTWQICAMTSASSAEQLLLLGLSQPDERMREVAEWCCDRYGELQRALVDQGDLLPPAN